MLPKPSVILVAPHIKLKGFIYIYVYIHTHKWRDMDPALIPGKDSLSELQYYNTKVHLVIILMKQTTKCILIFTC